jgi:hypothetical protein
VVEEKKVVLVQLAGEVVPVDQVHKVVLVVLTLAVVVVDLTITVPMVLELMVALA